jgi:hypothetical protein
MLVTITERLLFIVPANQKRPLQILEIPLIANMEYEKGDSTLSGYDTLSGQAELRLHLRNTGFYIFNGFKSAIDVVHLGFESHHDRDAFCHTLVIALQNLPTGLQTLARGQSDEDTIGGKERRPKKQSHAIMIDLSQDDIISGDTQPFSYPLQAPGRVFTSQHIDMSRSTDSSMSPISPLRPIAGENIAPLQPERDEQILPDPQQVQAVLIQEVTREVQLIPNNAENAEVGDQTRTQAKTKDLPKESVATSYPQSTSQDKAVSDTSVEGPLPRQMQRDSAGTSNGFSDATSILQNLALDALHHASNSPITPTAAPIAQLEDDNRLFTAAQITTDSVRPSSASALASSGKTMAAKPDSSKQTGSTTLRRPRKLNGGLERKTNRVLQNSHAAEPIPAEEAAVDWDEDLRADEEEMEQSKPARASKAVASRGARSGAKKSAGIRTISKPPAAKKKGKKKDRVKENKAKAATARATLATTRPRRTAPSVSYDEHSEQEDHSEGSVIETNEPVGLAGSDKSSPSTNNTRTHRKTMSLDEQHVGDVFDDLTAGPPQFIVPPEAVVEVSSSSEAPSATVNPITHPDPRQVEGRAPGPDRESDHGPESEPDQGIPELPEKAQVEAVEDSHPMTEKQRADAINGAGKSFGSGLLDAINETGMQPIQTSSIDLAVKMPFGDKSAFVDSVKSVLKQGSRKSQARASSSGKRKHDETPSISKHGTDSEPQRTPPNDYSQSGRVSKRSRTPAETSRSYQQAASERSNFPPQDTDAVKTGALSDCKGPTEVLSPPHGNEPTSYLLSPLRDHRSRADSTRVALLGFAPSIARPELPEKTDAPSQILLSNSHPSIARSEPLVEADNQAPTLSSPSLATTAKPKSTDNAGSLAPILPSNSPTSTAKQEASVKTGSPVPGLQLGGKSVTAHNNSRKRGAFPEINKPQQAKKARKTDPGSIRDQRNDGWMQNLLLPSQQTENGPTRGPTKKQRISEPTARISSKAKPDEQRLTLPWMQHISKPTRTSGVRVGRPKAKTSGSPSKLMQTKTETPRRHGIVENPPRLTDDYVQRKAQIVCFSAKGPRNQGVLSSVKQGQSLEQSSPVPSETGKHLAFKSLHIESTATRKPATAVPNPFGPLGRLSQRQVELPMSDLESADDETHVNEESGENPVPAPAPAEFESGKKAPQTFKVDVNGSPRLNLPETFHESQKTPDDNVVENSGDVNEISDVISVVERPDGEELESHNSTDFGLQSAVSDYTAANAQAIAKKNRSRDRPSIGMGKLLDRIFPHANESIKTNLFKSSNPSVITKAPGLSNSFAQFDHGGNPDEKAIRQGSPNEMMPVDPAEAPWFDIEQLDASVANGQSGSIVSARVRRLRSTTPPSPSPEAPQPNDSPPSFNTRLGQMIMPPPPRKEATKADAVKEYESDSHRRGELSALIDAETTLVNGEASEAETNLLSSQGQQRSSPSSSGDEDGTPIPASQNLFIPTIHKDRTIWNQKVSQTQQTIKEILEQVSEVSAFL